MQKFMLVVSVPLGELETQVRRMENWPTYVPELESVTSAGTGRYLFSVRQTTRRFEVPVAIRRSPRGSGMLWTSTAGPAWNGHLYLHALDASRTRVHVELDLDPRSYLGHLVRQIGSGRATSSPVGLLSRPPQVNRRPAVSSSHARIASPSRP